MPEWLYSATEVVQQLLVAECNRSDDEAVPAYEVRIRWNRFGDDPEFPGVPGKLCEQS